VIFVDSNIPMYLVGADHPHKRSSLALLEQMAAEKKMLVTNTEVLQEILHRYTAIRRKDFIQKALDALYDFVDEVFAVAESDVLEAKELLLAYDPLSARDALHAAHMKRLKIETIFSFDQGFDVLPGLKRVS
jgi:predicted nucleic acid-binding protein